MRPSRNMQSFLSKKAWFYKCWKLSDSDFVSSVKSVKICFFFPDFCVPGVHKAVCLNISAVFKLVLLLFEMLCFRLRLIFFFFLLL